jgi:serine/threonine protein phosphatase PrpC
MAGWGLDYETAEISLIGDRAQNQDRVAIARRDQSVILLVVDGMGGHAEGELAAQVAMDSLLRSFAEISNELENPAQYLTDSVERAHDEVASLGAELALQDKPRATCAVCLVVGSTAWWSHVGDSRVYLLRDGQIEPGGPMLVIPGSTCYETDKLLTGLVTIAMWKCC